MGRQKSNIPDDWDLADITQRVRMIIRALPNKKMDQNKLKKLLEVATPEDQIKLKVLHNAVINCIREYKGDSTSSKLKDWKSAEGALDAFIDTLWSEHFDESGDTLPNLLAVVEYLAARGWKIKKTAAYQHRKEGKIRPQKNGSFRIGDVEKYATVFLKRLDGIKENLLDTIQHERIQAEVSKLKAQARHWDMKASILEGSYVEKGSFELALVKRLLIFKNDIETFIYSQANGIINLVSGDSSKAPDLIEYMLDQAANWLDRYADDREFQVPLPTVQTAMDDDGDDDDDDDDYDLIEKDAAAGVSEI